MLDLKSRYGLIALVVSIVLLIPGIAMQSTDEVNWKLGDFVVAGILLSAAGLLLDYVVRNVKSRSFRIGLSIAVLLALFLIWAELAVGVFGSPVAGH